jgi:hypothetical protein
MSSQREAGPPTGRVAGIAKPSVCSSAVAWVKLENPENTYENSRGISRARSRPLPRPSARRAGAHTCLHARSRPI